LHLCDQFPALLVQEVDFTGGEPLLRPDWPEIAAHLGNLGITTGVVSNGATLNPQTISRLREVGVSHVAVSIDGLEETHDLLRGGQGSFRDAMNGLLELINQGIPTTVITTVSEKNIDQLPAMLDEFAMIGVERWRPQPLISTGRVLDHRELLVGRATFEKLVDFFVKSLPEAEDAGIELLRADGLGYFFEAACSKGPWHGCPAGLVSVGITSDGKVKGCLSLTDSFIEGDLREKSLWDIWFDEGSFEYSRKFTPHKLGENCKSCQKGTQCRGGCTAMSFGYSGELHNDPLCWLGFSADC